jgi:hypothetical protein
MMDRIQYAIARWLLNHWLRKNPTRCIPLIQELHKFAELKLTVREYEQGVQCWEYVRSAMDKEVDRP